MKNYKIYWLAVFTVILSNISIQAQDTLQLEGVTIKDRIFKNTIRFNLTNPIIFGDRALILGYERTIGDHQSFSVNFGLAALPSLSLLGSKVDSIIELHRDSKEKGFLITGDYRFYLAKEINSGLHGAFISGHFSLIHLWDVKIPGI